MPHPSLLRLGPSVSRAQRERKGGFQVDQLFYPKSVVVIGVSERTDNLARSVVENLFEFQFNGEIFFVGQKRWDSIWEKDLHFHGRPA